MMPNVEEKYFEPRRNDDEFRNEVIGLLQTGNGRFRFQKVNGEIRVLKGTLDPNKVPETKTTREISNPERLVVFDLEAEGWRTVVWEKLLNFTYLEQRTDDTEHESTWEKE